MESLFSRRRHDTCFTSKFVNGFILCHEILQLLNFQVAQYLPCKLFHILMQVHRTSYYYNTFINCISRECNELNRSDLLDTRTLYTSSLCF